MCGRAAGDEEAVPLDEFVEGVTDRVSGAPDTYGLHHARVPKLAAAEVAVKHLQDDEASGDTSKKSMTNFYNC